MVRFTKIYLNEKPCLIFSLFLFGVTFQKIVSKELFIDYNRGRKKFDDIIDDDHFKYFLNVVQKKIVEYRDKPKTAPRPAKPAGQKDKYELLQQIASLKEQGILSNEEFEAEKKIILYSCDR